MAKSNIEIVTTGLDVLLNGLRPYVLRELKSRYGERWWKLAVEDELCGTVRAETRWAQMSDDERFNKLDVHAILSILNGCWNDVFQEQVGYPGLRSSSSPGSVGESSRHSQTARSVRCCRWWRGRSTRHSTTWP